MNTQLTPETPSVEPSVGNWLQRAWDITYGMKWQIWWPLLSAMIVFTLVMAIGVPTLLNAMGLLPENGQMQGGVPVGFMVVVVLGMVLFSFIMWFIICPLIMVGVYKANNLAIKFTTAFKQCKNVFGNLLMLYFIYLVVIAVSNGVYILAPSFLGGLIGGFLALVVLLVSYYVMLALMIFAVPFIVTRKFETSEALKEGFRLMNQNLVTIVITFIAMIIITTISAIPLGIGLIWTIPMMYALHGVIFTSVSGMKLTPPADF